MKKVAYLLTLHLWCSHLIFSEGSRYTKLHGGHDLSAGDADGSWFLKVNKNFLLCNQDNNMVNRCVCLSLLPPTNEVCEGYVFTFLQVFVCSRGGVCLSACWDSRPPPEQAPPGSRHPHPPSRHPSPCAVHAGRYGQQGGGKHPTGMHTCSGCL